MYVLYSTVCTYNTLSYMTDLSHPIFEFHAFQVKTGGYCIVHSRMTDMIIIWITFIHALIPAGRVVYGWIFEI